MSIKLLMNNIADSKIWIGWIPQDLEGTGMGITREEEMAEEFNKASSSQKVFLISLKRKINRKR